MIRFSGSVFIWLSFAAAAIGQQAPAPQQAPLPLTFPDDPDLVMDCKDSLGYFNSNCNLICNTDYFRGKLQSPGDPNPPYPAYGSGFTVDKVEKVMFYKFSKTGGGERSVVFWQQVLNIEDASKLLNVINWAYVGSNMHCTSDLIHQDDGSPNGRTVQLVFRSFKR